MVGSSNLYLCWIRHFALRNENLDLLVLKRVFDAVDAAVVAAFVKATPTGIFARRAWYQYDRHDEALRRIMNTVEMPDRLAENLLMFITGDKAPSPYRSGPKLV